MNTGRKTIKGTSPKIGTGGFWERGFRKRGTCSFFPKGTHFLGIQAANASREPRVYLFIYCIAKEKRQLLLFFFSGKTFFFIFSVLVLENKKEIILFACPFKIIC